ncbi:SigE family RNA polymerase sigma factor [Phycicoccus sp. CSK15P-2]|uniref:RNA polymerase sigma factor n=1 Tax=Phycicoccus sp. CSK15P-2 TaxID=2807627 RepID=UPI00194FDC18|nr:SigE family RNA polymerase sigma factor [Phycicoccus sp. CSK15P-2]MBM6402893.1 SigE family RNA polymerase sigma factor [Phycicoccus sp. CSK15P-2]
MDPAEFDAWYDQAYPRLVHQIHAMIGDREEAADCVQEAFVRAWSRRRDLSSDGGRDAWIRTTAYRLAVSRWRRMVRGRRDPDRALGLATHEGPPDETRVAVVTALRALPEAQRRAIVLHHLADLPVAEVAAETGVPVGTVKARLARGRTALATLLHEGAHHG